MPYILLPTEEYMNKKFLLIVEGDEEVRGNLVNELRDSAAMIIVEASDGVQAAQKTRNQKFDVILSEFDLAKLSEGQLISAMREAGHHNASTPLLIYSKEIERAKKATRGLRNIEFMEKPAAYDAIAKKLIELSEIDPDKKQFKLDVDFINPFIDSSMNTLNSLCGANEIKALKPYMLGDEKLEIDISGTLSITSPYFKGNIAISFDNKVYKELISRMLEESIGEVDLNNQDGAAEIINIIFGQTKAVLNQRGYSLQRAIPSVVRGYGHKIAQSSKVPVLLVPFNSEVGRFWMQICVKAI